MSDVPLTVSSRGSPRRGDRSEHPAGPARAAASISSDDGGPRIVAALPAAGHDGLPELIVRIAFENGAQSDVIIDNAAGLRLLARCGVDRIEALVGRSWREVRDALQDLD